MQNNEKNVQNETTKEVKKAIAPLHEKVRALRKEISELKENNEEYFTYKEYGEVTDKINSIEKDIRKTLDKQYNEQYHRKRHTKN